MAAVTPGSRMPWWLKMGAKIVLARIPVSYDGWRRLGVFRHGAMIDGRYATDVFQRHYARAKPFLPPGFTVVELGPGDSLATAVLAAAHGAGATVLVDAGAFATRDLAPYNALAAALVERGLAVAAAPFTSVEQMLEATHTSYLTGGLRSLRELPAGSAHLVFSQAVLEHVALDEFDETIREMRRVTVPGGVSSHRIDLQDHLAHSLNSLRFSRGVWESRLMSRSGFYTNRLRASQVVAAFERAGFSIADRMDECWPQPPLPAHRLHRDFAALPAADLCVRGLDLLARA